MNAKAIIPLAVAIVLGVIAAKLGRDMMAKKRDNDQQVKLARIVVARQNIAPGTPLSDADLALDNHVAQSLPEKTYSNTAELIGRVVTAQLVKGQAICEPMLAPKGTVGGASAIIPEGMRAVTLEVNEFSGVAGLIVPGSRVDVVHTIRSWSDRGDSMMARTIVENLKVIAVGKRTGTAGTEVEQIARSVTVVATQDQAEVIDLAAHMGNPRLVLRNGSDEQVIGGKGVTVAELKGLDESGRPGLISAMVENLLANAKPAPATTPQPRQARAGNMRDVEVIRAGALSRVKVPKPDEGAWTDSGSQIEEIVPEQNK
jgi:pilus assembly protein CpaB